VREKDVLEFEISFPENKDEQQKIVKILDAIQEAVEIQEKIIEKTKELKKSLMAELFKYGAPSFRKGRKLKKTEIGEIPEDWEVVRLGEVCGLRVEQVFPKEDEIYVGLEHIDSGEIRLNRHGKGVQVRSLKNKFYANDILYNKLRPYLDKAVIVENEGICSTDLLVIKCNKERILPYYLINLLHTSQFLNFATSTMTGTNHPRTSWDSLKIFKIPLPPLPEQQEIAEILQTVDQKIEIERRKKELYEELFKTVLNKIMNQEIDVENIEV
jgi:type I restriction enzyme S subunit